jgi:hypothetical protein
MRTLLIKDDTATTTLTDLGEDGQVIWEVD